MKLKMTENKRLILGNTRDYDVIYLLYYLILVIYDWFAKLWLLLFPARIIEKKYMFSLCTCFKNEASNLKEWVEYHKLIGVDHFYLYNNNSTDNYMDVLTPYIEDGSVTLVDFPQSPIQPHCYEHWINTYRQESSWLAMTDIDEYLVPLKDNNIKDWLNKWKKYPVIQIYWKMFGASGKIEHDNSRLNTEQYTNSWPKLYDCGKIIFNTNYDINISFGMMHHTMACCNGLKIAPVNVWRKMVMFGINRHCSREVDIQINHYWSRAYEKYVEKLGKGDSAYSNNWKNFDTFLWHEQHNTSVDMTIYRFMVQLKLKMNGQYPM